MDYYQCVRQTLGEPDAFVLRYCEELKIIVSNVILQLLNRKEAYQHIAQWSRSQIPAEDQALFHEKAETELLSLHKGNLARYRIRRAQFSAWQQIWLSAGVAERFRI